MKHLLIFLALILFKSGISQNLNEGEVISFQKISETEGDFSAPLYNESIFGICSDNIGDLNNDGIEDLIVGARGDNDGGNLRGAVYILFLNTDATVKSHQKISSTQGNFNGTLFDGILFGSSVAGIGDLNDDGINDVAVGSRADATGGANTGSIWILFLNRDGTVKSHQKISQNEGYDTTGLPIEPGSLFGGEIDNIGDIDKDGLEDLAVGALYDKDGGDRKGSVWALRMNANGTAKGYYKITDGVQNFDAPIDNLDYFGGSVAGIKDFNKDGIPDIAVGAGYDDDGYDRSGAIYLIMLNIDGSVKSYSKISNTYGNLGKILHYDCNFSSSISGMDDIDGNGTNELIVGAYRDNDGGSDRGAAYILFLNPDGSVLKHQKISDTRGNFTAQIDNDDRLGVDVSSISDINKDGKPEIIIGAYRDDDGGYNKGAIYILSLEKYSSTTAISDSNIGSRYSENFDVYPNPTNGLLYIKLNQTTDKSLFLNVFDAVGKNVRTEKHEAINNQIVLELKDLPKGTYILHIENSTSKSFKKIIIN